MLELRTVLCMDLGVLGTTGSASRRNSYKLLLILTASLPTIQLVRN